VKEFCIRGLAESVAHGDKKSLPKVEACILNKLVREIVVDTILFQQWIGNEIPTTSDLILDTTVAAIDAIGICAKSLSRQTGKHSAAILDRFHASAVHHCLQLLVVSSQNPQVGGTVLIGPLLRSLASLVALDHLPLSSSDFGTLLETSLHAVVQSLPDSITVLESTDGEAMLVGRCAEAAGLVRALFLHASSWRGLSSIVRAVHSLGANGPLPLVRWMSVRIISDLVDVADVVKSEEDINEFVEVFGCILPRIFDSVDRVREEAKHACEQLMQRWEPTSDVGRLTVVHFPQRVILRHLSDRQVPGFILGLISHVHDSDKSAAEAVLETLVETLATRATSALAPENAPADAIVEAILGSARIAPIPLTSHWNDIQKRLVESLRYIAAVRFPITIQKILTPPMDSKDKCQAIHAFARNKTTLVFLVKELMERMSRGDDIEVAVPALSMVLDCFDDSGVASMARKYFGEIFASLLVIFWHKDIPVKPVIHKLFRAAHIGRIGDSVTPETGIRMLREEIGQNAATNKIFSAISDYVEKFYMNSSAGYVLASQLVGVSESIDSQFLELFENVCRSNDDFVKIKFAIRGIRGIVARWTKEQGNTIEDVSEHVKLLFGIMSGFVTHMDDNLAVESMSAIGDLLNLVGESNITDVSSVLVNRVLVLMRRVIDHRTPAVRVQALTLLARTCDKLNSDSPDQGFYSAVGDLWVPCVVRTQDRDSETRLAAQHALAAIINSAFAETPVSAQDFETADYATLLDLAKREIAECSYIHIDACAYYLIGLSAIEVEVVEAAIALLPVIISMVPEPSTDAVESITEVVEKILNLNNKNVSHLLADILVQAKSIDPEYRIVKASS
jgi:hypothetical protein